MYTVKLGKDVALLWWLVMLSKYVLNTILHLNGFGPNIEVYYILIYCFEELGSLNAAPGHKQFY